MNDHERAAKFGAEYGVDPDRAFVIIRRARALERLGVKVCNGDAHPRSIDQADKDEHSRRWQHVLDCDAAEFLRYVQTYGFDGVQFNGLAPSLVKDGRTVFIPLD